jgi:predicted kinase
MTRAGGRCDGTQVTPRVTEAPCHRSSPAKGRRERALWSALMERPALGGDTPTLYVMVGLPASGKTTRAKEIERDCNALRLTPGEWMIPLFADLAPRPFGQSLAGKKRDVLEGRLVWLALRALQLGTNVVLDFGVWARDERSALHHLALAAGARFRLVYMEVHDHEQARRVQERNTREPAAAFAMTPAELRVWRQRFQAPDEAELIACTPGSSPPGYPSWEEWAAERWPTSRP